MPIDRVPRLLNELRLHRVERARLRSLLIKEVDKADKHLQDELAELDRLIEQAEDLRAQLQSHASNAFTVRNNRSKAADKRRRANDVSAEIRTLRKEREQLLAKIAGHLHNDEKRENKACFNVRRKLLIEVAAQNGPPLRVWLKEAGVRSNQEIWWYREDDHGLIHLFWGGRGYPDGTGHGHAIIRYDSEGGYKRLFVRHPAY